MDWPNLTSGLVGALIGAILGSGTTVAIYWHSGISAARLRIMNKLTLLRHHVWWDIKDDAVFNDWNESLSELWEMYHAYYVWAPFWKKKKLDRALRDYKGTREELIEITPDSKRAPFGRKDFIARINESVAVLK